jgi:hypothetical protein
VQCVTRASKLAVFPGNLSHLRRAEFGWAITNYAIAKRHIYVFIPSMLPNVIAPAFSTVTMTFMALDFWKESVIGTVDLSVSEFFNIKSITWSPLGFRSIGVLILSTGDIASPS